MVGVWILVVAVGVGVTLGWPAWWACREDLRAAGASRREDGAAAKGVHEVI